MRTYIVARHGETDYNLERRVQGTLNDSILTYKGISQAASLGVYIAKREEAITRTYCSPLQRCRQTYAAISGSCNGFGKLLPDPTIIENLKEIELKEWQGRLREDVMVIDSSNWEIFKKNPCDLRLQNGTFAPVLDCFQRAISTWDYIRTETASNNDDVVFIMSHGAIGQCMILHALGLDRKEYGKCRRYALDNCECFEIEWADDSEYSSRWRKIDSSQAELDWQSTYSAHLLSGTLTSSR